MGLIKALVFGISLGIFLQGNYTADAGEVTKHTTPAGHEFWHHPVKGAKRSAVAISWKSGLGDLPKGQEMAARLGIDLMLNGGAAGKAPEEIISEFEDLDAGARLFVQPEEIRGFIVTPDKEMMKAAKIANDVLATPNLSENWFRRERDKLVKASRSRDNIVEGMAWNLSREILMENHPYKHFWSIRPTKNVEAIKIENINKWHKSAFGTKGLTIATSGSTDVAAISLAIDQALKGLPNIEPAVANPIAALKMPAKTIVYHAPKASKSAILVFGKLPPATANDDVRMNISLGVLGYGKQSRLFKAVRTGLRAAYGFGAGYIDYTRNHRLLRIWGEVETAQLQAALDATRETYSEFRSGGIGFVEFPFARRFYRQRIEESFTKPSNAAFLLLESRLNGAPENDLATLLDRINNLDRGEVNTYIKDTFMPFDDMLKIIVTPDASVIKGDCTITDIQDWKQCL